MPELWLLSRRNEDRVVEPASAEPVRVQQPLTAPADSGRSAAARREGALAGGTLLRVRVRGMDGGPVEAGTLGCLYSGSPQVEEASNAVLLSVPLARTEDGAPAVLEFPLPGDAMGAIVTAAVPGFMPTAEYLYDLRTFDGVYHPPAESLVREIEIVVGRAPAYRHVSGRVTVEGQQRIPPGLEIKLVQNQPGPDEARDWQDVYMGGERLALISPELSTYLIGPVTVRAEGLWITSDTTVPVWISLEEESENVGGPLAIRRDVDLSRGEELTVRLVDAVTKAAVPHYPLTIAVSRETSKNLSRSTRRSLTTGPDGMCTVAGLPSAGSLAVYAAQPGQPERSLVSGRLERMLSSGVLVVELDDLARQGQIAGSFPLEDGAASDSSCFAPQAIARETKSLVRLVDVTTQKQFEVPVDKGSGAWGFIGAPGTYRAWGETDRVRTTEVAEVQLVGGLARTSVDLRPSTSGSGLMLRYAGALAVPTTIRLRAQDGVPIHSIEGTPESPAGTCHLPVPNDQPLVCEVVQQGGESYNAAQILQIGAGAGVLDVDLNQHNLRGAQLSVDGKPITARLSLYRLDGPSFLVSIAVRQGASDPAPVPGGRYYYRVDDHGLSAVVCGIVDAAGDRLLVDWVGVPATAWEPGAAEGARSLVVSEVEGLSLESVPAVLRTFPCPDIEGNILVGCRGTKLAPR